MITKSVVHIIPTLQNGGAETVLTRLVAELSYNKVNQTIVTLQGTQNDFNHQRINQFAEIIHLQESSTDMVDWLDDHPNTVIIAWMYRPIIKAHQWRKKSKSNPAIYWNIRNSNFRLFQILQRCSLYAFGLFSHLTDPKIIYCSYQAKKVHERYFFSKKNQCVIPNRWAKVKDDLPTLKQPKSPVFLYVGRYDTMKGPKRLTKLFKSFSTLNSNAKLHIAGSGWSDKDIPEQIKDRVILLGNSDDIYFHYANATALLFTSYSEGYPNVLVEAMISGLPIIAFEAGDAKLILQDYPFGSIHESNASFVAKMKIMASHPYSLQDRMNELSIQKEKLNFNKTVKEYQQYLDL